MYASLVGGKLKEMRHRAWHAAVMRSGLLTALVLVIGVLLVAFAIRERGRGHVARLKAELQGRNRPVEVKVTKPGGQEAVVLERTQVLESETPEFQSATLLPGRGLEVLQITAYIPGKGQVKLLTAPTVEEIAKLSSDAAESSTGGEFELPWAGALHGLASPDGRSMNTTWRRQGLNIPVGQSDHPASGVARGGLLRARRADTVRSDVMPDGGQVEAVYRAGNFDGHWPSTTEITTSVLMSGRDMEMKVVAHNTGTMAVPIGMGWRPRFAILSGNRGDLTLRLPSETRLEVKDEQSGLPTGKLISVAGTAYDFSGVKGAKLGDLNLDESFVHLRTSFLDNGPAVELRDTANNFGLRITAMTPAIRVIRVVAPAAGGYVSIAPEFNYDDPFGKEWSKDEVTGMVVVQPGESVQWKIRLEIFGLKATEAPHL